MAGNDNTHKFLYLHPPYMIKVFREVANNFKKNFVGIVEASVGMKRIE